MWSKTICAGLVLAGALGLGVAAPAHADGYPPFFGYSPYLGGPTTYFTPENDIHETTNEGDSANALGTRTYYRGGPFWTYQATPRRFVRARATRHASRHVLRRRY